MVISSKESGGTKIQTKLRTDGALHQTTVEPDECSGRLHSG